MKEKKPCPFGDVLVKTRNSRGITQYRLAKLVQRNSRYISQLEHNRREPRLSTVIMLARAMGVDVGELVREVERCMYETEYKEEQMAVSVLAETEGQESGE